MNGFVRTASVLLAAAVMLAGACNDNDNDHRDAGVTPNTGFTATPLISDQAGVAPHVDAALVNSWGLAMDSRSFWIANNGSGKILVVDASGAPSKTMPVSSALTLVPGITGIVPNTSTGFVIGPTSNSAPAQMLVASETGQIFAVNANVSSAPQVVVDRSQAGAVYKGLAIFQAPDGTMRLAAADFHNARVDVFDTNFKLMTTVVLVDPNLRAGLAPFNVAAIGKNLFVTYAVQDTAAKDDVPGVGNGRIDEFDFNGNFVATLLDGGQLNAPWGLALAPSSFGRVGGQLIVGNFGDGTLLSINLDTSRVGGQLLQPNGSVLMIDGLWGLQFGNGQVGDANTLYFTAGPGGETHGLFGRIEVTSIPTTP